MIRFGLLGPLEVLRGGRPVEIGGRQPRVLLTALLVACGRPVPVDALADAVWEGAPPSAATGTLQTYVSRLRRRLGADAPVVWDESGYRLDVDVEQVDLRLFEVLAEEGRRLLDADDTIAAREVLSRAGALWRGPALGEVADLDFAIGLATRLEERRLAATEDRLEAELRLGHHTVVTSELTELVTSHPLRERLQGQLALALYRSGRQAEALRALAAARTTLRDELGLDLSRPLRDLESAILAQDSGLDVGRRIPTTPISTTPGASPERSPGAGALIGRDAELAALVVALEESADDARFVVLEGEPGIGKTRLADELRTIALERGATALWGRTDEGGAAPALWPWLVPLRDLVARVGATPPALVELLAGESPLPVGNPALMQYERFEAVADVLRRAGAHTGVVILIDDLQWADDTSLELLGFLVHRAEPGLLVVCTVRQLDVGRNDAVTDVLSVIARRAGSRRLMLRGLNADATSAVAAAASGMALAPALAAEIHARAEGNPFYAIELSRLVDADGDLVDAVPGGVGDVIRRRLATLPAPTAELLAIGAVVGRDVVLTLLARASERTVDDVVDAIEPAVVQRLLVEVPEHPLVLRFSHALVRQVMLDDLTSLRRARLHLKVADAIDAGGAGVDDAEVIAQHLWQAASVGVAKRAAAALERAAEVALRRVSYAAAEDLLTKAVQLRKTTGSSIDDDEAELLAMLRLLEVARALRFYQGVNAIDLHRAKDLAERCGRRDLLVELAWFEWSTMSTSVHRDGSESLGRAFVALTADDPDPAVRASGHQVHGVVCWQAGLIVEACESLDRARALLDASPPPASPFLARQVVLTDLFWIMNHALRGDLAIADAFARFDALIAESPDRFRVASVCGFAAIASLTLGRWSDGERYANLAAATDPQSQFGFFSGLELLHRGILLAWRGDVDEALPLFAAGKARYLELDAHSGLPMYDASLAIQMARHGRVDASRVLATAARAELDGRRELWTATVVLLAEAAVAEASGDARTASALREHAVAVATEQGALALADLAGAERAPVE